jgi:hypothetical protein
MKIMLSLQQLIETISLLGDDEPDAHLAEKLGFGRRLLLRHANGLLKAKANVSSFLDKVTNPSGLPHPDEKTLRNRASLITLRANP